MPIKKPLAERLWSNIETVGECLVWAGYSFAPNKKVDKRYGMIYGDSQAEVVHRVAWELVNGPIPDGYDIGQLCGNSLCVRNDHLFMGKLRGGRRKLSDADKYGMKQHYMATGCSQVALAQKWNCSTSTVARVVRGLR